MYDELARNKRKTVLLITGFVLVVLAVGWGFGALFGYGPFGLIAAAIVATIMSVLSYRNGDKVVLRLSRAKEVLHADQPRLHNLVEGLCIAAGMPKPRLYIVDDPAPNAFATGRDPEHASLAFTTGLLEKLNRVELEGVVAHELAHVKNRDTLVMSIVATLVGVLVLTADWTLRSIFWGGGRRRGGSREGGGAAAAFLLIGLVGAVLMPIFARIMQASVSRRREFLADMTGVQLTRYPPGLIGALEKLKEDTTVVRTAAHATGHLWIESPLDETSQGFGAKINRLFHTHPPLDERIRILREL